MTEKVPFRQRITKLFQNNIVIRKIDDKQIKVRDFNNIFQKDKNKRPYSGRTRVIQSQGNNIAGRYERMYLYSDYEQMDRDAIISSTLDILADECTVKNEYGEIINIETKDPAIKRVLENLFYDILNVEYNLWSWVRETCKYGDHFIELHVVDGVGVVGFRVLSPYNTTRIEEYNLNSKGQSNIGDVDVSFIYTGDNIRAQTKYENAEVLHFRMIADTSFLPYGKSLIEGARKEWQRLNLMEDAMLIQRIMRAPEKRVVYVDVGNMHPGDIDSYMEQVISEMKKTPYYDNRTGDYNLRFNMENAMEDLYIPVRGGDSGDRIETLQGLQGLEIDDIEYLKDKMIASLKVPKAFLNYSEDMSGKATLAAEDIRFARTIERIQRVILSELYKVAMIHLYAQGFEEDELMNFEISLNNPSTIADREKVELLTSKVSLARDMMDTKLFDSSHIYQTLFKLSNTEIKKLRHNVKVDSIKFRELEEGFEQDSTNPTQYDYDESNPREEQQDEEDSFYDRSSMDNDPTGQEELQQATKAPQNDLARKFKGSSPLAVEKLLRVKQKSKKNKVI